MDIFSESVHVIKNEETGEISEIILRFADIEHDLVVDYEIDGFHLIRNDQLSNSTKRPAHGVAVYIKSDTVVTQEIKYSSKKLEFILTNIVHELTELQIVFL